MSDQNTIIYTRYWWKRLYQRYQGTKSQRKRKTLRREMRKITRNLLEMMAEVAR